MSLLTDLKEKLSKGNTKATPSELKATKDWYTDRYEWMLVQRNMLAVLFVGAAALIAFLSFSISYIKSTKSIEPFVIEIEPKTGVPTVVEPLSAALYTGDEAVTRYFVWNYIKMREEYNYADFNRVYRDIRVFSEDMVYGQYKRAFNQGNLQSPFNLYGQGSIRTVELKSLILQEDKKSAQIRFRMVVEGGQNMTMDKIVLMRFDYQKLEMSDDKRLLNPLGFTVTSYKIDDERI